jgi:RNA-dependent RNA polymerase
MDVSAASKKRLLSYYLTHTVTSSFCTVLDGAKTGKTLLQTRYSEDRNNKDYGTQAIPPWKLDRDPGRRTQQHILLRQSLPPFVMDVLREATEHVKDECLRQIEERFKALPKVKDRDLIAPWRSAEEHMEEMLSGPQNRRVIGEAHKSAMDAIKTHVVDVYDLNYKLQKSTTNAGARASTSGVGLDVGVASQGGPEFTRQSIEVRQDRLRRVSRKFAEGPPAAETFVFSQEEVARLRASYAYLYDWEKRGGTRFPWNVAFDELGEIKLRVQRDFKPISRDFYEKMYIRRFRDG